MGSCCGVHKIINEICQLELYIHIHRIITYNAYFTCNDVLFNCRNNNNINGKNKSKYHCISNYLKTLKVEKIIIIDCMNQNVVNK